MYNDNNIRTRTSKMETIQLNMYKEDCKRLKTLRNLNHSTQYFYFILLSGILITIREFKSKLLFVVKVTR